MKVAILGASGFIGKNLARRLVRDGNQVTSFVRSRQTSSTVEFGNQFEFDFGDTATFSSELSDFDLVIHLVSSSNPASSRENPIGEIQHNLVGTINLLKVLGKYSGVKLIFASSGGAVYGRPMHTPIAEEHATDPISPYGVTKLAIEKYLHISRLESGLDFRILRLSNPYGPLQVNNKGQGLIPTVIEKILKGESVPVWGDGSNTRDYIYIDDVLEAFVKAVNYAGEVRTFNVGSGVGSSVLDIISEVSGLIGKDAKLEFLPSRESDPPSNILDVSLARAELGWGTKIGLQEGLKNSIAWNLKRVGL